MQEQSHLAGKQYHMSINLNGRLLVDLSEEMTLANRAWQYGDGLFETIRIFEGQAPFLPVHWERLQHGMHCLELRPPADWSAAFFQDEIRKLQLHHARVRLSVWRAPGGFYQPSTNDAQFLISANPLESGVFNWQEDGLNVRLCERVRIPIDALSGLKLIGATRYVAAAMEARAKGVDDVIVLNAREEICEASSSNILWIKNGSVCTPPATDGQVTGTFQKILCGVLAQAGVYVVEKACTFTTLMEADEIMLTNAIQGIRWVRFLEGKEFNCEKIYYINNLMVSYLNEKLDKIT